jgi:hypothetical protein
MHIQMKGETGMRELVVKESPFPPMQNPSYSCEVQVQTGSEHVQAILAQDRIIAYLELLNSKTNTMKQIVLTSPK